MSKSIALGLVCAGAILLAILLTGCSGGSSPTPPAGAVPTPTVTAQPGVTPGPTPTPTMAPAHTPTPVPTPAVVTLSLDEYLTHCAPTEQELADDFTFGDLSSQLAAEADKLEALTPPAQLSEWHMLTIRGFRTVQAVVDLQPKDEVIGFAHFILIAAAAGDLEEKLDEVSARLPEDVRRQMIEVGCIDPEDVPDDREDAPDDHGNDIDDATAIRVGADVRGALGYDGDFDYFRFQAERGQSYQIDVALGTLDDSVVSLVDSDGGWLDTNDDYGDTLASRLYWTAPSSGERYVAVEGYGIGTYTLTVSLSDLIDDHANSEREATAIRVGADVRGALDYDGDIDFFRFQAEQGQSYQIDVALGTLDDSIVDLYDSDGWLETNDNYGETFASRLYWEALSSGERYVAVEGYGIGTYTLTVSLSDLIDDHANREGEATAIRVGADVRGALDYDGDIDYFRFQAERGQSYQIDVALGTLDESIVYLYDGDGLFLDSNEDNGANFGSRLYWEAPSSGERYVVVWGYGTGTYTLTVSLSDLIDDHGDWEGDATAIRVGADVRGAVDYDDDVDFFRFQAERGQSYQIDVALGTLDDSELVLLDPDGRELAYNDDNGANFGSRLYWEAPSSGERYVVVWGYGTGTYTLTVSLSDLIDDHGNSEREATAIRVGADVRGALDYDGDIDFFRFQAEEGRSYPIDMALGTLDDSTVSLIDSDGQYAGSYYYDRDTPGLSWEAPSSGEFYVAVESYGIGTYTLTVSLINDDHANSEERATAIRVGTEVRGALDYDGDFDYFRFQAERGQIYQIDVALGTLDDSIAFLFDSNGYHNFDSGLYWTAPSSGEHYVSVEGYGGIGTYTLTVSLIIDDHGNSERDATEIRVGTQLRGALGYDEDIDYFRFQAEGSRSYRIDVALGTLGDSFVRLFDFDGRFLDSNDDYGNTLASHLLWRASSSGERYVAVTGYGRGTYTLTVSIVDDHSSDFESATRIALGEAVGIELEFYYDTDVLVFRARPGTEYVLTLNWESYQFFERFPDPASSIMTLFDADGRVRARLMDYDFSENRIRNKIMWQAATGGDYYIVVGYENEDTTGAFVFSVTER